MSKKIVEFGGGLGDIITQMYLSNRYIYLDTIKEMTDVLFITHNPFAIEILDYHKNKHLMNILYSDWVPPGKMCLDIYNKFGLNPSSKIQTIFNKNRNNIHIYLSDKENEFIKSLSNKYVVIQPYAGAYIRDIPENIFVMIVDKLIEKGYNSKDILIVGRNYKRYDIKANIHSDEIVGNTLLNKTTNLIDKISVRLFIKLVSKCSYFIGTHSSGCNIAWYNRIPNLILFDEATKARHFDKLDEWSFGKDFPESTHSTFENFNEGLL